MHWTVQVSQVVNHDWAPVKVPSKVPNIISAMVKPNRLQQQPKKMIGAVLNKLQENWMFVASSNNPHIDRWKHTDLVNRLNNTV